MSLMSVFFDLCLQTPYTTKTELVCDDKIKIDV